MAQNDNVTILSKYEPRLLLVAALLAALALLLSLWNGYNVHKHNEAARIHVHIAELHATMTALREGQARQLLYMENAIVRCLASASVP